MQGTHFVERLPDVFEDEDVTFDLDSPEPKQVKKTKPQYPYEDDDDDDLEFVLENYNRNDVAEHEDNNDDSSTDSFDSFSDQGDADDENTGDDSNLHEGPYSEEELQDNLEARELELSQLIDVEDEIGEVEENVFDEEYCDQSRLPKKDDK